MENGSRRARYAQAGTDGGRRRLTAVAFDDYPLWLETVSRVAESVQFEIVGTTTAAAEAATMVRELRPSLFILGVSGAESTRDDLVFLLDAVAEVGGVSTIVVSSDDDPDFIDQCLSGGASAYVLKTIRPDDLSSTIQQAIDRCVYLFGEPQRPRDAELDKLTPRELDVLLHVADGLSNAEVAQRLWISTATVKFHLTKLYEKLGVTNRTGAVRWAQQHGLLGAESTVASASRLRTARSAVGRTARSGHSLSRS